MVERMKGMPPPVRSLMAELVQESFAQLHQENQDRVALNDVKANAAP